MRIFCSICKELFIPYSEVKITSCGHLYHDDCISRWAKQHKTCPQCRSTLSSEPFRVYFEVEKDSDSDIGNLQYQVDTLTDKLREIERANKNLKEENEACEAVVENLKQWVYAMKRKNDILKGTQAILKEQLAPMLRQAKVKEDLQAEVEKKKEEATMLQKVNKFINASTEDVNNILESTPLTEQGLKQLCTFISVLKMQVDKTETKNSALAKEKENLIRDIQLEKNKFIKESQELLKLKSALKASEECQEKQQRHNSSPDTPVHTSPRPSTSRNEVKQSKNMYNIDLDSLFENEEKEKHSDKFKATKTIDEIKRWESLVCAGPVRNLGRPLSKSKSLLIQNTSSSHGSISKYAYDGMGGSRKIGLGFPTPKNEFEKIKKHDHRKSLPGPGAKKITEYFTLD